MAGGGIDVTAPPNSVGGGVVVFLFGVSDVIEFFTGAWWKPPALIVFKAVCVTGIVFCGMQLRGPKSAGESDDMESGHAAEES